jgi:hypothetical protein
VVVGAKEWSGVEVSWNSELPMMFLHAFVSHPDSTNYQDRRRPQLLSNDGNVLPYKYFQKITRRPVLVRQATAQEAAMVCRSRAQEAATGQSHR